MKPRLALGVVAATSLVVAAGAAAAGDGTATLTFSTKRSHAASTLETTATFAKDAQGNQRVLTAITLVAPVGTTFNPHAVKLCPGDSSTISDDPGGAEHACPAASKLGSGTVHLLLGGNETTMDATAWNQKAGPTLELKINGTPAYTVNSTISANKITFPLGLAEQIQAETESFDLTFDNTGRARKPYIRTPSSCPKGRWKGAIKADVSGGTKISLPTTLPCKKTRRG